ncbi:hypothetical protein DYB31_002157 [Aphanomyces astaci]|uniref:PH domain-containing protein n=1 Tax=Aphanomyces astaci TaxID=112090 RepID=A0A397FCJ0_APHAT|nr:hypothetical protein DYB31_002157 [Aphanomyces astaci]
MELLCQMVSWLKLECQKGRSLVVNCQKVTEFLLQMGMLQSVDCQKENWMGQQLCQKVTLRTHLMRRAERRMETNRTESRLGRKMQAISKGIRVTGSCLTYPIVMGKTAAITSISTAVKQKGKKAANPSWCGWIYLVKTSRRMQAATWTRRRYCRVTDDKLYYFRDDSPNKGSKGWISLLDMLAMVHLPFRRATTDNADDDTASTIILPFLLLSPTSTFIVGFDSDAQKQAFADHLASRHRIPVMPVVTEDWSIVQLALSPTDRSSSTSSFIRLYLVFVGSGDLLFFSKGSVLMDIVCRIRMLDMVNVLVAYDGAGGNGLTAKPAAASSSLDGPTIDVVLPSNKLVRLEFDAVGQYEKWRELLVDALAGDYTGSQFSQRQAVAARRKQLHRQQKLDALKKKLRKQGRRGRHHKQMPLESAVGSDVKQTAASRSASSVDMSEWSGGGGLSDDDGHVDRVASPTPTTGLDSQPLRHRRLSITTHALQLDRQHRHRMLQLDFEKLQTSLLANNPKRAKRLARIITACARAIDTLGALAMFPPHDSDNAGVLPPQWTLPTVETGRVVSGDWFTTEPGGRSIVRHWQPRG